VQSELHSAKPVARLQALCKEILPVLVSAKDKRDCEFLTTASSREVIQEFMDE